MTKKDRRDNWFNNGANRLGKKHPVLLSTLLLAVLGLVVYMRYLRVWA